MRNLWTSRLFVFPAFSNIHINRLIRFTRQTKECAIRRPFRPGRRVGVHFVYHLPEVIARRSALLVESRTGKCQVEGGPGGTPSGSAEPGFGSRSSISSVFPISGSRICQSRNDKQCSQNEIHDIGTEILKRSRFFTKIIRSFYKSIIPQEIKSAGHSPSSGSDKI